MRVLVTGAASGIGRATAERLMRDGATLAGLDLAPGAAGTLAVTADVTDPASVDAAVTEAVAALGGLDAVATVAGVGDFSGDVVETAPDEWARVLAVNLTGTYLVARAAIPHLRAAGGGAIVTVSSQYGLAGCVASPAYVASKAGVIGLTKAMAIDHAREGIRVNCVAPGPVDTPMLQGQSDTPERDAREAARTAGRNLAGRPGRPEEIAATIAFLLSADAAFTTGSIVTVDGGWTAG